MSLASAHEAQRDRLLALLQERSYAQREVILSSGKKSDFYVDCKQSSLCAEGHFLLGQLMWAELNRVAPQALAVGGLTLGADPLASAVSMTSYLAGRPVDAFLIRKEAKGHGTERYLEGVDHLPANCPVVILEDVVTTGASTIAAIERSRAHGFEVLHAIAIVDRLEGGAEAIAEHCSLTSLFTRDNFKRSL